MKTPIIRPNFTKETKTMRYTEAREILAEAIEQLDEGFSEKNMSNPSSNKNKLYKPAPAAPKKPTISGPILGKKGARGGVGRLMRGVKWAAKQRAKMKAPTVSEAIELDEGTKRMASLRAAVYKAQKKYPGPSQPRGFGSWGF